MTIANFIKHDFKTASAFTGIADLKVQLLQYSAIVIMEEYQYFGVLTALDIVKKPHLLAIDCICNKTEIEKGCSIENAMFYMKRDKTEVLPVFDKKKIIGLVFKNDILEYLNEHNKTLQNEIEEQNKRLEEQNSLFKAKIQQQKQELELMIEQRTQELISLVETKEKFIRIIAHELRNPFNTILGFLQLLQKNLRVYDWDKIEKYLNQIYRTASATFELLVNLLDWLNAKNNKIPFRPEKTYISKLLAEDILTTLFLAEQKQITIKNNVQESICAYVDQNMMKTIFRNLITNAIKYTETNGTVTISALISDQFIEIIVKDTGIGLSPELLEKIFNTEEVMSMKGTASETGTGLGLLLCKEFIEIEGGKIWIESILGQGSEFKFTLPIFIE